MNPKWIAKLSFIVTGVGFIVAGVFAPDAWPAAVDMIFGGIGALLTFLGGWFRQPTAPM
jgi:hypothetical protein